MSTDDVKLPELIRGPVKIEWVNLNEGWSGEYDEADPMDDNLLRFDVSMQNPVTLEWEEVPDGSFCTRIPAETPNHILERALVAIMDLIHHDVVTHGRSKRNCEQMSWLCPEDFK